MKKLLVLLVAGALLTTAGAAPGHDLPSGSNLSAPPQSGDAAPNQSQPEAYTPNKALEAIGLPDSATGDILAVIKIFYQSSGAQELAAAVETYTHQDWGAYLYIVPRYAGSKIVVESMAYDQARREFLPDGVLFESTATEDYALQLQTDLPEGGPQLRVTISCGGQSAVYEPTYDGRGDTPYPVKKGRILLDEAPFDDAVLFTDGTKTAEPTALFIGDTFLGWTLDSLQRNRDGSLRLATFSGEVALQGKIRVHPAGTQGGLMDGMVEFSVAESSLQRMPYSVGDTRTLWFVLDDGEQARQLLGLAEGEYPNCEIVISSYTIDRLESTVYNTATLVSGKVR